MQGEAQELSCLAAPLAPWSLAQACPRRPSPQRGDGRRRTAGLYQNSLMVLPFGISGNPLAACSQLHARGEGAMEMNEGRGARGEGRGAAEMGEGRGAKGKWRGARGGGRGARGKGRGVRAEGRGAKRSL